MLSVNGLESAFLTDEGFVGAVRGISFDLEAGETLGLVGESGCGKTVTALSIMRLLPPTARIAAGSITLCGQDLLALSNRAMREVRGKRIAMVFQDSVTSLNPLLTVGRQITEVLEVHLGLSHRGAQRRSIGLLDEVGVPEPERRLDQYPHQLSGGLRQRVAVAIALAANPSVLIADEPTTALDVTIQAQLLELLKREQSDREMAMILITHDLGVVAGMADRLAVMYAGRIVEEGSTDRLFAAPRHPYTLGLLACVPRIDGKVVDQMPSIAGAPPPLGSLPPGCAFRPRCRFEVEQSRLEVPPLQEIEAGHMVACFNPVKADEWQKTRAPAVG